MKKSYLSRQIKLVSLSTFDLFTPEEMALYQEIIALKKEIDSAEDATDFETKEKIQHKRELQGKLTGLIHEHLGTPRRVNLDSVLDYRETNRAGVTWWGLKMSRRICEFESEQSRLMGVGTNEVTFDKVIIKWKNQDMLEQIIKDGIIIPIYNTETGEVTDKFYRFYTASAGQLRRDKIQMMTVEMQEKIRPAIECGMSWDVINKKGGINVSKILAYTALSGGATEEWKMDIDKCIVIDEFESQVTGVMDYISSDYHLERGTFTQDIDQTDGVGILLKKQHPFMVRGPWLKGLCVYFDVLGFCKEKGCPPLIKDAWGQFHRLDKEGIEVIFTTSQLKLYKLYDSWDDYKAKFKANGCHLCRTNWEDEMEGENPENLLDIKNCEINYQMLQTLTGMTDEEIDSFCKNEREKINNLVTNAGNMERTICGPDRSRWTARDWAIREYNPLLREGGIRSTIKEIKTKMVLNAKSGFIKCRNKRLFACPDLYAACENWFLHIKEPTGLVPANMLASKRYRGKKVDVLRSPHLYMEHAIRQVVDDDEVYRWFDQDVVYTSSHDFTSRILQFDWDGDHLNMVTQKEIIQAAEREIAEHDIVPLFYDAQKAPKEFLSYHTLFNGVWRAHENSGIGQVSNLLSQIWNKPDNGHRQTAAAFLTAYNNWVIDAAKTGDNNCYERYPHAKALIGSAGGGGKKMPYFFQFSKNGRKGEKKSCLKPKGSTMDRIALYFKDVGEKRMDFNFAGVDQFNYRMLLEKDVEVNHDIVETFINADRECTSFFVHVFDDKGAKPEDGMYRPMMKEYVIHKLEEITSLDEAYPHITKYLFSPANFRSETSKSMYWRIFGEKALAILRNNLANSEYCSVCRTTYPEWEDHKCKKQIRQFGIRTCEKCGKIMDITSLGEHAWNRKYCPECSDLIRRLRKAESDRIRRNLSDTYNCERCGKVMTGRKHKYCPECAEIVASEQRLEAQRRRRAAAKEAKCTSSESS